MKNKKRLINWAIVWACEVVYLYGQEQEHADILKALAGAVLIGGVVMGWGFYLDKFFKKTKKEDLEDEI